MSKLIQSGYNPKYPEVVKDYWRYKPEGPWPEWITDLSRVDRMDQRSGAIPEITAGTAGETIVIGPLGESIVKIPGGEAWVLRDPRTGKLIGVTGEQKQLLYEEI